MRARSGARWASWGRVYTAVLTLAGCVGSEPRDVQADQRDADAGPEVDLVEVSPPEVTGDTPEATAEEHTPETTAEAVDAITMDDTPELTDEHTAPEGAAEVGPPTCNPPCVEGTCVAPGTCECIRGFVGPRCEERAVCDPPCDNGGVCVDHDTCDCALTGFGGARCEVRACNGVVCPTLEGYAVDCNAASHCEYVRASQSVAWQADDIWIYVPAGTFMMGSGSDIGRAEERPQHLVTVARGYFIGKLEVTTRAYEACSNAWACAAIMFGAGLGDNGVNLTANGRARHPQNAVTFEKAVAACAFLGGRLPSEAEWERAANGSGEHRLYPWGNAPTPSCGVHAIFDASGIGCGTGGTAAVGPEERTSGASAVGALDMVGNVDEWVADCWHDDYNGAPSTGEAWTTGCSSATRVTRGNSYAYPEHEMRTAARNYRDETSVNTLAGVRCARDVEDGGDR